MQPTRGSTAAVPASRKVEKNPPNRENELAKAKKRSYIRHILVRTWVSCGRVAQSVEQGTENPRVTSSILVPATIFCLDFGGKLRNKSAAAGKLKNGLANACLPPFFVCRLIAPSPAGGRSLGGDCPALLGCACGARACRLRRHLVPAFFAIGKKKPLRRFMP